ncbi:NucA/NucB deoxyribonuclease domain-containing protein [Streptomyces viridiviolaceus]|uniref:NucA/NucB deoxyribonuclease domain-containing protein n=1 Tax=Streptomyces viridiviolaceus TaxID=68282 RepID=A0ABW2EHV6_9ACTN|nr:NucA/NucB deoxyribonuclease domain-containing protein [Streptomyces viridiviolaceus]
MAASSAAGQRTTTEFAFVSRDPAPRDSRASSFAPENRRAGKALPQESAEDMAERVKASRKLREGSDEGPSTKRQTPDINVCMENSRTYREYGWTIDHFFHCQGTRQTLYKRQCRLFWCWNVGSFSFRATTIGQGYDNQRRIYYGTLLDQIEVRGDVSGLSMRHEIHCRALGDDPACEAEFGNGRTAPLTDWLRDRGSYHFFRSAHGGDAPDLKAYYDITQEFTAIYQDGRTRSITTGRGGHRCDSASYIPGRSSACVFDVVIPVMSSISIRDPEVRQTARNIRDAQYRPERTVPAYAAKEVPGAPDSGQPLTRNYYDRAQQDRSRTRVRAVCQQYWPGYAGRGLECDEYPFASTDQSAGANPPHQNFVAKAIPAADNGKGGEKINTFYKEDRILDSDPFYVRITS